MTTYFPDLPPRFRVSHWHGDIMVVRMTKDFIVNSSKGTIIVPQGFFSDGLSIPRAFWSLVGPSTGRGFAAGLPHDLLYTQEGSAMYPHLTRKDADDIFLEALYHLGVSWPKRHAMHLAVRSAGWRSYKKR